MPVVAEPPHGFTRLPDIRHPYALLGLLAVAWLLISLHRSRRAHATPSVPLGSPLPPSSEDAACEKERIFEESPPPSPRSQSSSLLQPASQPRPFFSAFTPPMPSPVPTPLPTSTPTSTPTPKVTSGLGPGSGSGSGSGFSGKAESSAGSTESSSFSTPGPSALELLPPRRRSYTKTASTSAAPPDNQIQVSGEIVVAEGWRRHTKVFGGGVCEACVENQRKMSA